MPIKKHLNKQATYFTKSLLFYREKKLALAIGFSWSVNGAKWHDENKVAHTFGLFKQVAPPTIMRALILGRLRLNFVTANKNIGRK
ncbi:hypothetical protein COK18_30515 [Bacillus cereus]|uniref:hypothetical protein n=1 Tax=Bacillus cereus TaxID=1396 RepID=UPI000BF980F6|nr:hypothetical protein [Bacillus cereus]PFQ54706.1 hypothetical protein COK18_30515 [Bacillus cereus]